MYLARFHGILVLNSGWELCGPQAGCNIGAAVVDCIQKLVTSHDDPLVRAGCTNYNSMQDFLA